LRLAFEDDLRCAELLFAGGFRLPAGASILTIVAVSPPRGAPVLPALIAQRRLPTTINLSKLHHVALALAVYASQLSFPLPRSYSHARLASGWWPTSTGRGSRPRKVPNEVSASSTWLPPHPSFRNASNALLCDAAQRLCSHRTRSHHQCSSPLAPAHGTPRGRHENQVHLAAVSSAGITRLNP